MSDAELAVPTVTRLLWVGWLQGMHHADKEYPWQQSALPLSAEERSILSLPDHWYNQRPEGGGRPEPCEPVARL